MKIVSFEHLEVWKKAHQLTLNIYKITQHYPKVERYGLVSQIRRSSVSICANLAEGKRKRTKEFLRYIEIAIGLLEETKYHLILSKDLEYLSLDLFDDLYSETREIGMMLTSMIKGLRNKI